MSAKTLPRGVLGVVHLPALPGDPAHVGASFRDVERFAMADAEALAGGGVAGLVLENFGSAPFPKGSAGSRVPPHHVATLALLARACVERFGLPVGVNCLRNDVFSALGVASSSGADFVRVNVHTGAYLTDQGVIEGEADLSLRYRASLAPARPAIAADVLVKHATPLTPLSMTRAVHEVLDRGLADAVIVTGVATGSEVNEDELAEARDAAGERAVWLGSGLTPQRAEVFARYADAAIVGTWLKQNADVRAPVDPGRVRELVAAFGAGRER
ncbi:MAG: BtpA/SgcQ family protein [Deltaproteobacteria bacterium]|nr:BtpA/SgcQ family protein [Deltaproteobacteria bacterium]